MDESIEAKCSRLEIENANLKRLLKNIKDNIENHGGMSIQQYTYITEMILKLIKRIE